MSSATDQAMDEVRVVVTGAAGQIAYSLLYQIGSGYVFGPQTRVALRLLDLAPMMTALNGVVMELTDCAMPLISDIVATDDMDVAFKDVDAAFLVGAMPRQKGMERKDLLAANIGIFKAQGQALNAHASRDVKVLVVGNPANTNALICAKYAPDLPKENFTAMTRLDQNRAHAQLALKAGVPVAKVRNAIIWGNHSTTQVADASHATIDGVRVADMPDVFADDWLQSTFLNTVQLRGATVIQARQMSSAMSAAKAASDHMRSWFCGTADGEHVSMGVHVTDDGQQYGSPAGIVFSMPCVVDAATRRWSIVSGLTINDFVRDKIAATAAELEEERDAAMKVCADA